MQFTKCFIQHVLINNLKKVLLGGSGILMYIGLKLVSKNTTAFSHSKDAVFSQLCFFNPNHAKPM